MTTKHSKRRDQKHFMPWWAFVIMGCLLVLSLAWTVATIAGSKSEAESAEESALTLAEEVAMACDRGEVLVGGRNICAQAEEVKENTNAKPARGPAGQTGAAGKDGKDGKPGAEGDPGKAGEAGQPGKDGQPGTPGKDGQAGAKGDTGPAGKDGTAGTKGDTGPAGPQGAQGPAGPKGDRGDRGVGIKNVKCTAGGDWVFTLTDDTTVRVAGPCRTIQPKPTPTEAGTGAP